MITAITPTYEDLAPGVVRWTATALGLSVSSYQRDELPPRPLTAEVETNDTGMYVRLLADGKVCASDWISWSALPARR